MVLPFEIARQFSDGTKMQFVQELTGQFTKYFLNGSFIQNQSTSEDIEELNYETCLFYTEPKRLTANSITNYGVRSFPHFGSYGFYTVKYTGDSLVLMPINNNDGKENAPTVNAAINGSLIDIAITDPLSKSYMAYRVVFRQGNFTTEYVNYNKTFSKPLLASGTYALSVRGYGEDGVHSIESEPISFVVP